MHERIVGDKRYELSNHLGNVLSTISDRKLPVFAEEGDEIRMEPLSFHTEGVGELIEFKASENFAYFNTKQQGAGLASNFKTEPGILNVYIDNLNLPENSVGVIVSLYRVSNGTDMLLEQKPVIVSSGTINSFFNIAFADKYKVTITLAQNTEEPEQVVLEGYYLNFIIDTSSYLTSLNYFRPDVLSYSDYYPYGMYLPGRHESIDPDGYRYGFNGKEKDDEIKGQGAQYDYGFRIYDPRLAKFLSIDPLFNAYPELTPYQFSSNTPISSIDLDGLEALVSCDYSTLAELNKVVGIQHYTYSEPTNFNVHHTMPGRSPIKDKVFNGYSETELLELQKKLSNSSNWDKAKFLYNSDYPSDLVFAFANEDNLKLVWKMGYNFEVKLKDASSLIVKNSNYSFTDLEEEEKYGLTNTVRHLSGQAIITFFTNSSVAKFVADKHELKKDGLTDGTMFNKTTEIEVIDTYVDIVNNAYGRKLGTELKKDFGHITKWTNPDTMKFVNKIVEYLNNSDLGVKFYNLNLKDKVILDRFTEYFNKIENEKP